MLDGLTPSSRPVSSDGEHRFCKIVPDEIVLLAEAPGSTRRLSHESWPAATKQLQHAWQSR